MMPVARPMPILRSACSFREMTITGRPRIVAIHLRCNAPKEKDKDSGGSRVLP